MAFLGLAGMLVVLAGLVSVLVPLKFLGIRTRGRGALVGLVGVVLFAVAAANTETTDRSGAGPQNATAQVAAAPAAPPAPRRPTEAEIAAAATPKLQADFLAVVERNRDAYRSGANDMQKGAARYTRGKEICSTLASKSVTGWVGQVATLSSNSDGRGVLAVKVSGNTQLKTWNNSVSDVGANTLLDPGGQLFAKASALKVGQWIKFDGTFLTGQADCVAESSLTQDGSMTRPEFVFRFRDVQPLDASLAATR